MDAPTLDSIFIRPPSFKRTISSFRKKALKNQKKDPTMFLTKKLEICISMEKWFVIVV